MMTFVFFILPPHGLTSRGFPGQRVSTPRWPFFSGN